MAVLSLASPAWAEWAPGNPEVAAAAKDAGIAAALGAVNAIDQAAVSDDHAAFAALLADDLVVNNPQNSISIRGATAQRSSAGKISYVRYKRIVQYAGLRAGMVLLMGEEIVQPKGANDAPVEEVHRRFTDLWKQVNGSWRLTARQATVIDRPLVSGSPR